MGETAQAKWADAKLARAQQHRHDLVGRIAAWAGTSPPKYDGNIADDRLSYEVRVQMRHSPPLEEWSLILGDALHNLRSALDVLVWSLAEVETLSGKEQKRLMWPVVVERESWVDAAARSLPAVPADVVARIEECQPFNWPESQREQDGLLLLHRLDIQDKHRLSLAAQVEPTRTEIQQSVEFHDGAAAARNAPPDMTIVDQALVNGATLLRGRTVDPIKRIGGTFNLTFQTGLSIDGNFVGALELLDGLSSHVTQVLQHVANPPDDVVS
ncbi:hypothetical protein [Allobranchiibius sp. GilTou38]|uniref:hypothetical protein n=1 Tax=Allobranchiibius sp. GilTou38 TaxID=2815210 RepID=UPI001AA181AB|nr:hypothetical protein [Allobranchiibius sp. GilTou38]MBO1768248.1 hypothetical protein [Allobranchiibius sp. GilTou38]